MKKWIYASGFFCFILILICVVTPISNLPKGYTARQFNIMLIFSLLICISVTVIMVTLLIISRYASKIDNLEKAEEEAWKKKENLNKLIRKYNQLICDCLNDKTC